MKWRFLPLSMKNSLLIMWFENSDRETAVTVLSQHIGEYQNYFTRQPMITEFEYKAHQLCAENGTASGADLNAIWTNLSKEYGSDSVEYYDEDSAEWAYINHIYFTNNYYTFNYAVSKAITLCSLQTVQGGSGNLQ